MNKYLIGCILALLVCLLCGVEVIISLVTCVFFLGLILWLMSHLSFPDWERKVLKVKSDRLKLEILEMQLKQLKTEKVRKKIKWRNRINTNI